MNELILIDCMKFMKTIADDYFDLAIVDPPYGIGDFNAKTRLKKNGQRVSVNALPVMWNNYKPTEEYFLELVRVSKKQIIWGANYYNSFNGKNGAIVWHKGNIQSLFSQCEIASLSFQQKIDYVKIGWQSGFARGAYEKGYDPIHPCQKPIKLYKWLIKNYAKPNDKLFDSHSGSGSFRIAAHDMGFDLTSCEIDEDYYRDNEKRFQNHIKQNDLFAPEELQKEMLQGFL